MISLIKKLSPSVSVPLFFLIFSLLFLIRFLFASVYGAFFLAIGLYLYVKYFTLVEPFTFEQLLQWVMSLPSEYKVAILSSFITIIGFIIAFHTATLNWKNQMKAQLKTKASDDIDNFFHIVLSNITSAKIYVKTQIRLVNDIQNGAPLEEVSSRIKYEQSKINEFFDARDVLLKASVEVHRLIGSNNNLLTTGYGMKSNLDGAANSLHEISKVLWLRIPIVNLDDENHIQSFLNQVNITDCNEFLKVCEINDGIIAGLTGAVRGSLDSSIWGFSFPQFINLFADRKDFKKAITKFRDDLNT